VTGGLVAALGAGVGAWPGTPPPPAVVILDFDPIARIAGFEVRWQILAIAGVVLGTILLAAAFAFVAQRRRDAAVARADRARPETVDEVMRAAFGEATEAGQREAVASPDVAQPEAVAPPAGPPVVPPDDVEGPAGTPEAIDAPPPARAEPFARIEPRLRLDDLLFIVIAGVAGAVVGGRLGYVLLHLDYYRADQAAILDPSQGSLTLAGGLAVGVLTALLVATILGSPARRWLGVAIVPLLLALGLGKLSMVLGGEGQGLPSVGEWATAYLGPGPWGSLAPQLPSEPSQVYEAVTTAGALIVVLLVAVVGPLRRRPVVLFSVGIGLWAIGRFVVAYGWRDPALVGSLNGDQVVTLVIASVCGLALVGSIAAKVRERRRRGGSVEPGPAPSVVAVAADEGPEDEIEIPPPDWPHPVDIPVAPSSAAESAPASASASTEDVSAPSTGRDT